MGAIIYGGNFLVRGQFSSGAIVRRATFLGGNYPGGNHPGSNYPGVSYSGANFPRGQLS